MPGSHANANFGNVSCSMIRAGRSAPHAVTGKRPPILGVVAEDTVGFGDDVPPLDIMDVGYVALRVLTCFASSFALN